MFRVTDGSVFGLTLAVVVQSVNVLHISLSADDGELRVGKIGIALLMPVVGA